MNQPDSVELYHDMTSEYHVMCSCLMSGDRVTEARVNLSPDDFQGPRHRILFQSFVDLQEEGNPIDHILVVDWLRANGRYEEAGGSVYLAEMIADAMPFGNFGYHVGRVMQSSKRRRVLALQTSLAEKIEQGASDADETFELLQREIELVPHKQAVEAPKMEPHEFLEDLKALQANGLPRGEKTGWPSIDPYYRVPKGQWTVLTGIPGHGKTSFMNQLMTNLMSFAGWKFLVLSAENLPYEKYLARLITLIDGRPFFRGPSQCISLPDMEYAMSFIDERLRLINPGESITFDEVLRQAVEIHKTWPFEGLVLDPWNEMQQVAVKGRNETEIIGDQITKFRRFCQTHAVHGWIVAHPAKMKRESDGNEYLVPTTYDIAGSAHWRNKADFALCVHRSVDDIDAPTQIHIQKVRFRENGQLGLVELAFDRITSGFKDIIKGGLE